MFEPDKYIFDPKIRHPNSVVYFPISGISGIWIHCSGSALKKSLISERCAAPHNEIFPKISAFAYQIMSIELKRFIFPPNDS